MSDHASDIAVERDTDVATGGVKFTVLFKKHANFTATERAALKTAADSSWSDLRAAWVGIHGSKAEVLLDSLTADEKTELRRTMRVNDIPPSP